MANGEAFEEVQAICISNPQISFGVHLVIDELDSLTKSKIFAERGIIDKKGVFVKSAIQKVIIDKDLEEAVFSEWDAQICRIKEAGIHISHIDSHHHYHTLPQLYEVVKKISDKHQIGKVRLNSWRPLLMPYKKPQKISLCDSSQKDKKKKNFMILGNKIINYVNTKAEYCKLHNSFKTADFFTSVAVFYYNVKVMEEWKSFNTIELMCHPGHPNYTEESLLLHILKSKFGSNYMNYWQL